VSARCSSTNCWARTSAASRSWPPSKRPKHRPTAAAAKSHVKVLSLDELVAEGDKIDVVFDLSGGANVAEELHRKYAAKGNQHTIVAPERMAHLMLTVMENQRNLPDVHPQP